MCLHGANDLLHNEKDCLGERENRARSREHLLGAAENGPATKKILFVTEMIVSLGGICNSLNPRSYQLAREDLLRDREDLLRGNDLLPNEDDLHQAGLGPQRGGDGHFRFEGNVSGAKKNVTVAAKIIYIVEKTFSLANLILDAAEKIGSKSPKIADEGEITLDEVELILFV